MDDYLYGYVSLIATLTVRSGDQQDQVAYSFADSHYSNRRESTFITRHVSTTWELLQVMGLREGNQLTVHITLKICFLLSSFFLLKHYKEAYTWKLVI